jgi:hypothetical protein
MDLYKLGRSTKFPLILPLMQKLEFIRFLFTGIYDLSKDYKVIYPHKSLKPVLIQNLFQDFLQLLIKNSPNLKKIVYSGPFDVDFSGNLKLKHIEHR